jgi:RNA polymerase sigma factor (sigma-70 family)
VYASLYDTAPAHLRGIWALMSPSPEMKNSSSEAEGRIISEELLSRLTPREREVAALIARGLTNRQIADILTITRGTVANHVASLKQKLGLANRTQVAALIITHAERSQRRRRR